MDQSEDLYRRVLRLSQDLDGGQDSSSILSIIKQNNLCIAQDFPCALAWQHGKTNLFEQWVIAHKISLLDDTIPRYRVDEVQVLFEQLFYRVRAVHEIYPISILKLIAKVYTFQDVETSLLFNSATGRAGRQIISTILSGCEPRHMSIHGFIQGMFVQQTQPGWEGESVFSLFAYHVPYDCLRVVNGYELAIKEHLDSVWASIVDPVSAAPASNKSGLARLLVAEGKYGIEVFLKLISLTQDNMYKYAKAIAKCLYSTHTTHIGIKYRPVDKLKPTDSNYQKYYSVVLSSPSLFEALVIEGGGDFVKDLLLVRRQDAERFENALAMVNVLINHHSENKGLQALCLLPEGIELLNQLTQSKSMLGVFIEMGGKAWRRVLVSQHEGQYLFLKVYETLPGKQLIRWLVFNQPGLYDIDLYFVTELRKMMLQGGLKALAEPEDSYGTDESEGQSILYKLLIQSDLLSRHPADLSGFVQEMVAPNEEGEGLHVLEQLSKFRGGQVFLAELIRSRPLTLLLVLSHDRAYLKYFSYYEETRTVLGYFSKIDKSHRERYAELFASTLAHQISEGEARQNILGIWVQHEDGRSVLTKLLEEMPEHFQENSLSILNALSYEQMLDGVQTQVLGYLAHSERYPLLWQILYTLSASLDAGRGHLWQSLIAHDNKMLAALIGFPQGIQMLNYIIKHYHNFRLYHMEDLLARLFFHKGRFAGILRQDYGINFWFDCYMHHAPLMETYTKTVVEELCDQDLSLIVKEIEDYEKGLCKEGNTLLISWVRAGSVVSIIYALSKKAKKKLVALCIPILTQETSNMAVNPGEAIIGHIVSNEYWYGFLSEILIKYKSKNGLDGVFALLNKPISAKDLRSSMDILEGTQSGVELLKKCGVFLPRKERELLEL